MSFPWTRFLLEHIEKVIGYKLLMIELSRLAWRAQMHEYKSFPKPHVLSMHGQTPLALFCHRLLQGFHLWLGSIIALDGQRVVEILREFNTSTLPLWRADRRAFFNATVLSDFFEFQSKELQLCDCPLFCSPS